MQSFEQTKSEIANSALGKALGMLATWTWGQIVAALKAVVNRGKLDWSGSNTTYNVPAGYYSGGTLDSRPSYNAGVAAGKSSVTSMQVRDNKAVSYISQGTQSISFSIPANTIAHCLVFCDYRTGYTALSETLSSGTVAKNDMQNLQVSVTGGHTYINRLYTISTGASSATFTLTATGAITGMLMH